MNYYTISDMGPPSNSVAPQDDIASYCAVSGLESGFMHTLGSGSSLIGPNSAQCQRGMAQRCSDKWDGVCEYVSNNTQVSFPNAVQQCNGPQGSCMGPGLGNSLTQGEILVRNTAAERFVTRMSGNCQRVYQPFDPTVAGSPLISSWQPSGECSPVNCPASNKCVPIYDVNARNIDSDIVMNKVLDKPWIALDILVNIYNHRANSGRLQELNGTRLYRLFTSPGFQQIVKAKVML